MVLLRCHIRYTKHDEVDEVELIEANPQYTLVRHPDGRQTTISLRDLAPAGDVPDPKTTLVRRSDLFDTENQLGDHCARITLDTLPQDDDTTSIVP